MSVGLNEVLSPVFPLGHLIFLCSTNLPSSYLAIAAVPSALNDSNTKNLDK